MRVLDLTGSPRPFRVEVRESLAVEMLLSLCLFENATGDRALYETGNAWLETAKRRASPDLLRDLDQPATPGKGVWAHLIGLAYASPSPHDVPAFLHSLKALPALELQLHSLGVHSDAGSHHGINRETALAALHGDKEAQDVALSAWGAMEPHGRDSAQRLFTQDPDSARTSIIRLLEEWYDQVFREEEPRVAPIVRRDADARRSLAKSMPSERLVELATNGIRYRPEPGIEIAALVPSVFARPWVILSEHEGARIFCYPVADESMVTDVHAPPAHLVRLYDALADERRLRVLRKIAQEPCSLQELADFLGIAKSTMHHHLAILRGAGLLSLELHGKRYTLRREALGDLPILLDGYLGG